ncbi:chymotrypsin-like protease CTRL-1 [Aedes albopictus]|uniref:Peptidase S1 domain-containing protein n=1 Tax=Aedes albopictus TaxID=7160 RepID=A0ABM1XW64_AEDAL
MFHRYRLGWTSYVCGVTIVTEQFVLTAAHCTYEGLQMLPANRVFIKVGFTNLDSPEDNVRQFDVDKIIRHEEYEKDTFENDIALLKLSSEIAFTSYIQPVCLWQGDSQLSKITSKIGFVIGWGLDEGYNLPKHLSEATMPIVSSKTCWESDRLHYNKYYFESKTFCAGRLNSTHVSHGDSGGGLYMRMGTNWIVRGLVSNAKINPLTLNVDADNYVMFTDVAYYLNWIKSKVPVIPYFAVDTKRIIGIESDSKDNLLDLKNCGTPGKDKVFVNQHPWYAYISRSQSKPISRFWCLGVLIHPSFLITVARCRERNAKSLQVSITNCFFFYSMYNNQNSFSGRHGSSNLLWISYMITKMILIMLSDWMLQREFPFATHLYILIMTP